MTSVTAFAPATVSNVALRLRRPRLRARPPGRRGHGAIPVWRRARRPHREHRRRRRPPAARRGAEHRGRGGAGAADASSASAAASALSIRKGCRCRAASAAARRAPPRPSSPSTRCSAARSTADTLIACALEGERLGAGSAHADNIAPCICGGFVLVRRAEPARHPAAAGAAGSDGRRRPSRSRDRDGARRARCSATTVPLSDAVRQWANLGALVDGLHRGDFALISRVARGHDCRAAPRAARARACRRSSARRSRPARSAAACRDPARRSSRCARRRRRRARSRTR